MDNLLDTSLLEQLKTLNLVFEQIKDWVVLTDVNGTILYVNNQVEELSGYSKKEIIGQKPSLWKSDLVPVKTYKKLWDTITNDQIYVGAITNRRKDGRGFTLVNTISPIKDEQGIISYFVSIARDITQNSLFEEKMHHAINHDLLTGLLTRKAFLDTAHIKVQQKNKFALLVVAINKLSLINSTYGFVWGDKVIQEVGIRIKDTIGEECAVSRLEGNMIGILLPDFKSPSKIVQFIETIQEAMKASMSIENKEIYLSIVFGVSIYPDDMVGEEEAEVLLTRAQLALFQAKSSNSIYNYEFYTFSMNEQANAQLYMENELYKAFKEDEFIPYYQPIIDIDTGKICGLEALMRRETSTGEIITPASFVSYLEETGLIIEVGMDLIDKICFQMRKWIDDELSIPVAINLSPLQFKEEDFFEKMMETVTRHRIPASLITFEITETLLVDDINQTKYILNRLKSQGFTISIDDFGTGYSSLSYLQAFNIDNLKIDLSFIRDIVSNEADQAIVRAIIMMSEGLGLETIAEGIETQEQLKLLQALGCDNGQGYFWGHPLSGVDIWTQYLQGNHKGDYLYG